MAKRLIIGIDEVGRGPLAGPITVCAVSFWRTPKFLIGVKDSKKLSPKQREEWNDRIRNYEAKIKGFKISISSVSPRVIDKVGISKAAELAVSRCLNKLLSNRALSFKNYKLVLDGGLYAPPNYPNQSTIIKGDEKVPLIAAASIIAKVTRDKKMIRIHKKFPLYGFNIHKGYGTKKHQQAIRKYGLSDRHRKSFCISII